jgi:hypothetical protein
MKRFSMLSRIVSVIISLAILLVLVPFSPPVCLAEESTIKFPFTEVDGIDVSVTFPNGEGVKYETGYSVPGVYSWSYVVIWVNPSDIFEAKAKINLNTSSGNWRLILARNMSDPVGDIVLKDWSDQPREYTLDWTKTPRKDFGYYYCLEVKKTSGFGIEKIYFLLLPLEQDTPKSEPDMYVLTLKHYAPFFDPPKGSQRRPGDIVATITEKDTGLPVAGKKVWIYWEYPSEFEPTINWALAMDVSYRMKSWWSEWSTNYLNYNKAHENSLIGYGNSDAQGELVASYFPMLGKGAKAFANTLKKEGQLNGTIWAVVVNGATQQPETYASVSVKFLGVAEIRGIFWNKDPVLKKIPSITVTRGGTTTPVTDKQLPYYLLPGDKVKLEDGDRVDVGWATGTKMKIEPVAGKSGEFEIADENAGGWVAFCAHCSYLACGLVLTGAGWIASLSSSVVAFIPAAAAAGPYLGAASVVIGIPCVIAYGYNYFFADLSFQYYSTILLEISGDKEESTMYVVEGKLVVYKNDTETEVTGGQKITITGEGEQGPISSFNTSELSEDLRSLLEENTENSASTSSGLTFESRSRPQGTEVQIPLTLNEVSGAIGNLDLNLSYDPGVLEAIDVIKGSLCSNSLMESNITTGSVRIAVADGNGFTGDGSVVYVKFKVIGAAGASSPLNISACLANRADYDVIDITKNNGIFKVSSVSESQGDWDGNKRLTPLDALAALQMAVGKRAVDLTLDMNSDGKVTSLDARNILKAALQGD